jgi:predicted  nucleic acid-binding Zn-ribbon protein
MVLTVVLMAAVVIAKLLAVRSLQALRAEILGVRAEGRPVRDRLNLAQAQRQAVNAQKMALEQKAARLERELRGVHRELRVLREEEEHRTAKAQQDEQGLVAPPPST